MAPSLLSAVGDLARVVHDPDGEHEQFRQCSRDAMTAARRSDPATLTAAIEMLVPLLHGVVGVYSKLALLAGTLVEWGGSPLPLCDVLPRRAAAALQLAEIFPGAWQQAAGGEPPADLAAITATRERLVASAAGRGIPRQQAELVAWSWFEVMDWGRALITAMTHREFRAAMEHRDWVRDAARAMADQLETAACVLGLALVLDDEPLVVLDPASGRGFGLTMSGVGDSFQLHTLLADRLSRLPGAQRPLPGLEAPKRGWVKAATDGKLRRPASDPIVRRFRLFDGHGAYVFPEGRPADIQPLDGTRVLVLHPPLAPLGWTGGRFYEHMHPVLTLDRELDPAEAADWLARVAPAVQDDMMAWGRVP
jgi:hypothetical protein